VHDEDGDVNVLDDLRQSCKFCAWTKIVVPECPTSSEKKATSLLVSEPVKNQSNQGIFRQRKVKGWCRISSRMLLKGDSNTSAVGGWPDCERSDTT
jgi:hypothetical protein